MQIPSAEHIQQAVEAAKQAAPAVQKIADVQLEQSWQIWIALIGVFGTLVTTMGGLGGLFIAGWLQLKKAEMDREQGRKERNDLGKTLEKVKLSMDGTLTVQKELIRQIAYRRGIDEGAAANVLKGVIEKAINPDDSMALEALHRLPNIGVHAEPPVTDQINAVLHSQDQIREAFDHQFAEVAKDADITTVTGIHLDMQNQINEIRTEAIAKLEEAKKEKSPLEPDQPGKPC